MAPDRLTGWVDRFGERHGELVVAATTDTVELTAADGAIAWLAVGFPPLPVDHDPVSALAEHAQRNRRVGAILVRKGGYAVGRFDGSTLVSSKVGSAYVQGKTKAGGWSQQRYARRRANQADQAYAEAAEVAATVLLPYADELDAVVGGGDAGAVQAVLADRRLGPLERLLTGPVLATPDPRLRVLQAFPEQFRAIRIGLNDLA